MNVDNKQLDMFAPRSITKKYVDELVSLGFIGECSVVRNHMKTANNLFGASCVFHDVCYTAGGNEADRARADRGFYRRCLMNAANIPDVRKIFYYTSVATVWYLTVRGFGWAAFKYGAYRTTEEILELNKHTKSAKLTIRLKRLYRTVRIIVKRKLWPKLNTTVKSSIAHFVSWWSKSYPKVKLILLTRFWK